jgi:hypothetical protein
MFDEPLQRGSRLPESPRINALLAGMMGNSHPQALAAAPTIHAPIAPAQAPKTMAARPFSTFLKSIQWAYVPSTESLVAVTPGMPVREFFKLVNWSGDKNPNPAALGGSAVPPSVENLMSQFAWD